MYGYIYKFTNLETGKVYIGKHKYDKPELDKNYLTSGTLIQKSINKNGIDKFKHELVCICESLDELNKKEVFYIDYFQSIYPNGYNLTSGGDGLSEPSKEIREKISIAHRGRKQSDESNKKRSETLKKVIHTPEWIEKIRIANKGQVVTEQQREASSIRHKNTHWYNDGVNEFMLFDDEVSDGLVKGRLKNPFPNQKGKILSDKTLKKLSTINSDKKWYNNGIKEILIRSAQIPEGFVKGRLKKN